MTWSSPTMPKLNKSPEEKAWIISLVALGASLGPFIASFIVNKLGRKWTIIADMFLFLISWSVLAYCTQTYCFYFARILAGLAVGIVFTVVPMYVAEISPVRRNLSFIIVREKTKNKRKKQQTGITRVSNQM